MPAPDPRVSRRRAGHGTVEVFFGNFKENKFPQGPVFLC